MGSDPGSPQPQWCSVTELERALKDQGHPNRQHAIPRLMADEALRLLRTQMARDAANASLIDEKGV